MITKSIREMASTLALAAATGMSMDAAPAKTVRVNHNSTNRSHAESKRRKKRRSMQNASRKINRKP